MDSGTQRTGKGLLILIGGAEDRKEDMYVLRRMVEVTKARSIAIVPSASCYPTGVSEDYYYAFRALKVENIQIFDIRDQKDAEKETYLKDIENIELVFFSGGDQVKLFHVFRDSKLLEKIRYLHFHKGLHIAGTSAGAAIASDPMIYDGNVHGLKKGSVHMSQGFGLIKNVTIDTHFINRGRLGRLTQFLCTGITSYGIGIGENTAIVIYQDDTFEVFGTGMVTVVDTKNLKYSNYKDIREGDAIVIHGINVGFLQDGTRFDMKTWSVIPPCSEPHAYSEKIHYQEKKNLLNIIGTLNKN